MSEAGWRDGGRTGGNGIGQTVAILALAIVLLPAFPPSRLPAQDLERGKELYDRWCLACHGETGAGDGEAAAYMLPRPRDFRRAVYQIRSTGSGELPTDNDLRRVMELGVPGTAMPGWTDRLNAGERDDVIAYLKSFSRFFQDAAAEPYDFGSAPGESEEGLAEGARIYQELECFKCHGDGGRGNGTSAPTMTDDWDFPIRPADLTRPWTFNGGAEVEDIYRRMRTGLDGTPMPSFSDVIDAEIITEEQLWRVAQYVRSLAPGEPTVREVIRAAPVEGELPSGPTDGAWADVEPFFIPLVGQIIVAPRQFAPTVDGLWVRALHNGNRLALHLSWSDPSASPDSAWQEWLELIAGTMTDVDGAVPTVQGPDRIGVQFPMRRVTGMQRPFFLGGDARRPAYTWRWQSTPDQLLVGTATGLDAFVPSDDTEVTHTAAFAGGQWQLQLSRVLVATDSTTAPTFVEGEAIPIAFQAADGSSGEDIVRGSVSAWYAIYLDVPTPPSVFVMPVVAALLTAGLGVIVVSRAQRRERTASTEE